MIYFVKNKIFDLEDADLTASSEAEEFEKERLLSQTPSRRWRTTGDTSEYIDFDFGVAVLIDLISIIAHNLTSDAVITLKADDNPSFSLPEEESLTWNSEKIIKFFTSKNYRYWRLAIQDAANPDTYLEIGNIILGLKTEISSPLPRGWQKLLKIPNVITEGAGGQKFIRIKQKYNSFTVVFSEANPIYPDEYDSLIDFMENGGSDEVILVSLKQETDLYTHSFYGRIENSNDFKEITPEGHRTWGFEFSEEL